MQPNAASSSGDRKAEPYVDAYQQYRLDIGNVETLDTELERQLIAEFQLGRRTREQLLAELAINYSLNFFGHESPNILDIAQRGQMIEDGKIARATIIESNLLDVLTISKKYQGRGMPLVDIIQNGNLGLMRAVEKFDLEAGVKLMTYAQYWINLFIKRGFVDQSRNIRLPHRESQQLATVLFCRGKFYQENQRNPSVEEIAELTNVPTGQVRLLLSVPQTISLSAPINQEIDTEVDSALYDRNAESFDETVVRQLSDGEIKARLFNDAGLTDLEQRTVELCRPDEGGVIPSLTEVGRILGVSRQNVSQTLKRAYARIRRVYEPDQ